MAINANTATTTGIIVIIPPMVSLTKPHTCFQFNEPDNQSLSILTFTPTREDDGKYLTCRAENQFIEGSAIEDKWRLVVHCKYE